MPTIKVRARYTETIICEREIEVKDENQIENEVRKLDRFNFPFSRTSPTKEFEILDWEEED